MDPRRLRLLLALSRMGSMRAVADAFAMTTSTVSQQIAALARDTRTQLIEPEGRRVRLTPAGRRLADHAVTILAAIDAAQLDLDPDAEPAGALRVGGFATAIRVSLLPVLAELAVSHPRVDVIISEYEPIEAIRLLADDALDLALTYDYNLAPASADAVLETVALWSTPWGLAVPADAPDTKNLGAYAHHSWIVNSRNSADEEAVRTLGALAGFTPHIAHQIDTLRPGRGPHPGRLRSGPAARRTTDARRSEGGGARRPRCPHDGVRGDPPRAVDVAAAAPGP